MIDKTAVSDPGAPPPCCRPVTIDEVTGWLMRLDTFTRGETTRLLHEISPILNYLKHGQLPMIWSVDPGLVSPGYLENVATTSRRFRNAKESLKIAEEMHRSGEMCWRIYLPIGSSAGSFTQLSVMKNDDDYFLFVFRDKDRRQHYYLCDQIDCACMMARWILK